MDPARPPPKSEPDASPPPPPPPPSAPPPPPTTSPAKPTAKTSGGAASPAPPPSPAAAPPASNSSSSSTSSSIAAPTPASKLLNHQPLDAPDELDRKWYAHFYHMQKALHGKDEAASLAALRPPPPPPPASSPGADSAPPPPLSFQPDVALLYAIITEPPLAKQYLRYLTAVAGASDSYKNCIGWLQKLVDLKFVKLLVSCRSQLLWLVREFVHVNVPGVDKVIVCLLRYLPGGDPSRTTVWLASSIIRILIEHEAWLLANSSLIPFVFHTFARITVDHTAAPHANLLKQETDLCATLWSRRQGDVAQLGRELVRVMNDAKDIPGMNSLWKQLRSVRDDVEKDAGVFSVAQLMATPTPPKYLAFRLSPKMEEYLIFMMERVQVGSVHRYQKWFASHFLSSAGSDALVPDLVRYICAVHHPSNQILGSKVTPRYHILGWLYLLCKSPTALARAQLAMFFDFLYFKPSDNVMSVEPTILLMVKSVKSHPTMSLAMVQFLVFAVEKFAASATNRVLMQKGVSTAFSVALKVGVVPSILPLQSFPVLESSSPELKSELHRIFPEHFPSPENIQAQAPSPHRSPAHVSAGSSPSNFHSPLSHGYAGESPVHSSPFEAGSPTTSPSRSPSHSESSVASGSAPSDATSLSSSSFLPDNQQSPEPSADMATPGGLADGSALGSLGTAEVPASLLVLGGEDFKNFQEMLPEPGSRPTEGFLECLNDILISWIRQDNAVELAAPLGAYLHASLEKIIVSSKIGLSESPKATCAGVLDSMLDQVLSESQEMFVPFLHAMYARDITMSFRLLAFCCARASEAKSVDAVLAPYAAFLDSIGGSLTHNIVKDLTLSQHIDDARALACSLLDAPVLSSSAASSTTTTTTSRAKDEVGAVEATVLFITPYLFAHMHHPSLGKVMARSETLVQLVLGFATPSMLHALCARVMRQEFAVFRHRLANVLVSSLQWSSWEQVGMWDLVLAEAQAAPAAAAATEKTFLAAARKVLACINPKENAEAMSGLLKCLVLFRPDASVLQALFRLPNVYEDFPLAVLSCWIERCPDAVKSYVVATAAVAQQQQQASGADGTKEMDEILGKLERLQSRRAATAASKRLSASASSAVGALLLSDEAVASTVRKIVARESGGARGGGFPALAKLLEEHAKAPSASDSSSSSHAERERSDGDEQPASKKQRVDK
ncbi:hypothetical protein PybrP1_008337 [[Pythium] brassicae (nom. inval.)]|nr:hypothetical protein PybrP1_008337 [[Pythium] brassicae (nom. inval.)]